MNDMISLFNRLTSESLADYNLFAEIVDNHYEKFKYLYYMIRKLKLDNIDTILCKIEDSAVHVRITAKENNYINTIVYTINERRNKYKYACFFTLDIAEEKGTVYLSICMNDEAKEGDIYANRFV